MIGAEASPSAGLARALARHSRGWLVAATLVGAWLAIALLVPAHLRGAARPAQYAVIRHIVRGAPAGGWAVFALVDHGPASHRAMAQTAALGLWPPWIPRCGIFWLGHEGSSAARPWRWAALLVAGLADFCPGAGRLVPPVFTLRARGVAAPSAEALTFRQFTGAFVGASCLGVLATGRGERLWAVFRFAAGRFVAVGVAAGRLEWKWLSVTAADFLIDAVELRLLPREPRA
ncbi:MAG: hypothetical protein C0502_03460 [Opitutus sp.]|nr:hypothetical protein [Opitutus sp.]